MSERNDRRAISSRRGLLKGIALGSAALGAAGAGLFAEADPHTGALGLRQAHAASPKRASMAFIQWQPHTVPAAWSKGIEEVLDDAAGRSTTSCSTARTRSRCRSA